MASTRNKNAQGDFCLERKKYDKSVYYTTNSLKGVAHSNRFPCAGINMGHMPNNILASNAIDIESSLYGIGSTNLVKKKEDVIPRFNHLDHVCFFDRMRTF